MDHKAIGNRVLVLGCPGSGKSTFARRLRDETGLPLIHLDNIWWKADRTHISREAFDRELADVLQSSRWILDGDYSRTYEVRIRACDTVFFLDYGEETCLQGITQRIGEKRSDLPWTENRPDPELEQEVRRYRRDKRPILYTLFQTYRTKQIVIFENRQQAEQWLAELEGSNPGALD